MFEQFTVEEISLMQIFDTNSRDNVINGINAVSHTFDEDIMEIANQVITRLMEMSDEEYNALDIGNYDDGHERMEV
jgi:hypothetical protein